MMRVRHLVLNLLQKLFILEHNRLAAYFSEENSDWSDERIFQEARKWNVAIMQYICWFEYLPALGIQLLSYDGYKPNVNPSLDNFFASVAHGLGHQDLGDSMGEFSGIATDINAADSQFSASASPLLDSQDDGKSNGMKHCSRFFVLDLGGMVHVRRLGFVKYADTFHGTTK